MNPFGGPPNRYEDRSESRGRRPTMIERRHGEVGGLPDQDWPLRVTQIYRRDGSDWLLVHRHADPLAHAVGLEQAAVLARG